METEKKEWAEGKQRWAEERRRRGITPQRNPVKDISPVKVSRKHILEKIVRNIINCIGAKNL